MKRSIDTTNKFTGTAKFSTAVFLSFLCFCGSKPTSPAIPLVICGQNENISLNSNAGRFGYEMNGSWFPWGGKSTDFISAWNHAHKIFQNEQTNNVMWVFSPGVLWDGATVDHDLLSYYPGDSVVDINGLDGYNYGDIIKNGYHLHWQSFQEVFGPSLVALKNLGKPLWITEIGCAVDPRRADWIKQFLYFMDNNPCVETALWFNDHKVNEPDFQLESDSATFDLMKNWLLH